MCSEKHHPWPFTASQWAAHREHMEEHATRLVTDEFLVEHEIEQIPLSALVEPMHPEYEETLF